MRRDTACRVAGVGRRSIVLAQRAGSPAVQSSLALSPRRRSRIPERGPVATHVIPVRRACPSTQGSERENPRVPRASSVETAREYPVADEGDDAGAGDALNRVSLHRAGDKVAAEEKLAPPHAENRTVRPE